MLIFKPTKYQDMDVCPELGDLIQAVFASIPSLEFHACHSRPWGIDAKSFIDAVEVFDGEQKVGKLEWTNKYTRNGYIKVYRISSKRIIKERGDKNAKTTDSAKSAIKIAKQAFVKDTDGARAYTIHEEFHRKYNDVLWHYNHNLETKTRKLTEPAIEYLIGKVEGTIPTIDPVIVQYIKGEDFITTRDNCRIAKRVQQSLSTGDGLILYVDRNEKLTAVYPKERTLKKLDSTYDLPNNYQEKFAILKIMEYRQPIDGIGVRLELKIDDKEGDYYYLMPGEVIVTH